MKTFTKERLYPELMGYKCLKQDENIYFFAKNFNALCAVNLKTNMIEIVESLSKESFDTEDLIINILEYKNEIICIPISAKQIYVIDLVQKMEVGQIISGKEALPWRAYCNAYLEQDYCYLFPFTGSEFAKIDLKQKKIVKSINIRKIYKDFFDVGCDFFSSSDCYFYENKLYMVMYDDDKIVEVDILSMRLSFYKMAGQSTYYIHLTGWGNLLYVLGADGKIYIWNIFNHVIENILHLKFNEGENARYTNSIKHEKYIYVFKYIPSDDFIRINIEDNQAEVLSLTETFNLGEEKRSSLRYMTTDSNKFYFISKTQEIFIIDFVTKEVNIFPLCFDEDNLYKYIQFQEKKLNNVQDEPILEGKYVWTLENYIRKHINIYEDRHITEGKNIGNKIFATVKMDMM